MTVPDWLFPGWGEYIMIRKAQYIRGELLTTDWEGCWLATKKKWLRNILEKLQ
jgi:hypothetical protein